MRFMSLDNAILWAEGSFTCKMGAPWRWADLGMSKPYQLIQIAENADEAMLTSKIINHLDAMKRQAGFRADQSPVLYWRWVDKIRMQLGTEPGEDSIIETRVYLDGNPGRPLGNPSRPNGRPTVGAWRLAA